MWKTKIAIVSYYIKLLHSVRMLKRVRSDHFPEILTKMKH